VHLAQNATAETLERGRPFHHQQPCDWSGARAFVTKTRVTKSAVTVTKPHMRKFAQLADVEAFEAAIYLSPDDR
jgi:hypothetical protein